MSIKTDGLIEAGPFKVTASVSAGFVKNDASGNLLFGQAASAWDLIEFKTHSGAGDFGDFASVLDGDVDDTYQIMWQAIGQSSANFSVGRIAFNGSLPTGARFVSQNTFSTGTFRNLGNEWQLWREFGVSNTAGIYGRAIIHAKSGKIRTGESWVGAGVSGSFTKHEVHFAQRWNDTTTNITSIGFRDTFATVNRAWLYKIKTA